MKLALALFLLLPALVYSQSLEELSELPKPKPRYQKASVKWCAKAGMVGSDTELNLVKNRVDVLGESEYHEVPFEEVLAMSYKEGQSGDRNKKFQGTTKDLASIHKFEGIPIWIEGYFLWGNEGKKGKFSGGVMQGPETCNCKKTKFEQVDFHIWLVKQPGDTRDKAIVVEMAPRLRADKGGRWTNQANLQKDLNFLASAKIPVRIYGYLIFDGEHVGQLKGHTDDVRRGTLWEIHPIGIVKTYQKDKTGNMAWLPLY